MAGGIGESLTTSIRSIPIASFNPVFCVGWTWISFCSHEQLGKVSPDSQSPTCGIKARYSGILTDAQAVGNDIRVLRRLAVCRSASGCLKYFYYFPSEIRHKRNTERMHLVL